MTFDIPNYDQWLTTPEDEQEAEAAHRAELRREYLVERAEAERSEE